VDQKLDQGPTVALSIGAVAEATGMSKRQLRYIDKIGLVTPERSDGNQRRYSLSDLERLMQIRALRDSGYSLLQVRRVLARRAARKEQPGGPSAEANGSRQPLAGQGVPGVLDRYQDARIYFKRGKKT